MAKIKKIFWKISALAILAAPVTVMAQYSIPAGTKLPEQTIYEIIKNFMLWILGILGFLAVIGFVISGIMYLVAAGDEDAQKRAKRAMYYSITGVIVGLVGLIALIAAGRLLGGTDRTF